MSLGEEVEVEIAVGVRIIVGVAETAVGDATLGGSPQAVNKNAPRISRHPTKRARSRPRRKGRYRPSSRKNA